MGKNRFDLNELMGPMTQNASRPTVPVEPGSNSGVKIESPKSSRATKTPSRCKEEEPKTQRREKANFFCLSQHLRYIKILSSYRRKGPGSVIDDALSRYFGDPQIVRELRLAIEEEQNVRENDIVILESRIKSLE